MLPSRYVRLKQLPLSDNGKIDRRALATRAAAGALDATDYEPPRNEVERRLVTIWEEEFQQQPIGIRQDFFGLGGDSLLATAMFIRLEQEFGRGLSLGALLDRPTIAQLAELFADRAPARQTSLVRLQTGSRPQPLFCVPGVLGSLWNFGPWPDSLAPIGRSTDSSPKAWTGTEDPSGQLQRYGNARSRCGSALCSPQDPTNCSATRSAERSPTKWLSDCRPRANKYRCWPWLTLRPVVIADHCG